MQKVTDLAGFKSPPYCTQLDRNVYLWHKVNIHQRHLTKSNALGSHAAEPVVVLQPVRLRDPETNGRVQHQAEACSLKKPSVHDLNHVTDSHMVMEVLSSPMPRLQHRHRISGSQDVPGMTCPALGFA